MRLGSVPPCFQFCSCCCRSYPHPLTHAPAPRPAHTAPRHAGPHPPTDQKMFPLFRRRDSLKRLYIVRHGESAYNAAMHARGSSWADPMIFDAPLTELGRSQVGRWRGLMGGGWESAVRSAACCCCCCWISVPSPALLLLPLPPSHLPPLIPSTPTAHMACTQAAALRKELAALGLPPDTLWVTSPLQRAMQTLLLALPCGQLGHSVGSSSGGGGGCGGAAHGGDGGEGRENSSAVPNGGGGSSGGGSGGGGGAPEVVVLHTITEKVGRAAALQCAFGCSVSTPRCRITCHRCLRRRCHRLATHMHRRLPACLPARPQVVTSGDIGHPASELRRRFPQLDAQLATLPELWWYSPPDKPNCAVQQRFGSHESKEQVKVRGQSGCSCSLRPEVCSVRR